MTAEQLEELQQLAALPPEGPTTTLLSSLARRVLAAEKLVEAVDHILKSIIDDEHGTPDVVAIVESHLSLTAYREASK